MHHCITIVPTHHAVSNAVQSTLQFISLVVACDFWICSGCSSSCLACAASQTPPPKKKYRKSVWPGLVMGVYLNLFLILLMLLLRLILIGILNLLLLLRGLLGPEPHLLLVIVRHNDHTFNAQLILWSGMLERCNTQYEYMDLSLYCMCDADAGDVCRCDSIASSPVFEPLGLLAPALQNCLNQEDHCKPFKSLKYKGWTWAAYSLYLYSLQP